jgi:hypothetical protein
MPSHFISGRICANIQLCSLLYGDYREMTRARAEWSTKAR